MEYQLTCSLVTYNNDFDMLEKAIKSFLSTQLQVKLFIIDNSPSDKLKLLQNISSAKIEYIHNPTNPGFGAAHNIALKKVKAISPYHLILNPDIYFNKGVNESILSFLGERKDIGVLMPKIVYPDNSLQYVAKLLPTPLDFLIRRFIPIQFIKQKNNIKFELRNSGYDKVMNVPFLSGCYLVVRTEVLGKSNLFDENYFMYFEDIDFCRNIINSGYKSLFYPEVSVVHAHEKKSMTSIRTLKVYFKSMFYYFNKWGWFFDKQRRYVNKETLEQF